MFEHLSFEGSWLLVADPRRQKENFTANCSCRGFSIVLGLPKPGFGEAGINKHVDDGPAGGGPAVGKHDAPEVASVIGVRAKLPTPGITKPFVDTGQAADTAACWIARLVASL